jgi:hypothetical protein
MVLPETLEEALSIDSCTTHVLRRTNTRILRTHIIAGRIICILDNGVLEAYRYGLCELVKNNLSSEQQTQSLNTARRRIAESAPVKALMEISEKSSAELKRLSSQLLDESKSSPRTNSTKTDFKGHIVRKAEEDSSPVPSCESKTSLGIPALIVLVDKDLSPFQILPRVPLATLNRSSRLGADAILQLARLTVFSKSGRLVLSAGHGDGRVVVREIDPLTCEVLNAGDFRSHRHPVVFLATDSISDGLTDVVASIDSVGQMLVWTVSRLAGRGIISRRPQRLFRCKHSEHLKCDISWSMGIIAVCEERRVSIFSIERNELIHCWTVTDGSTESSTDNSSEMLVIRKLSICNEGFLNLSLEVSDSDRIITWYLASFTLSGTRCGVYKCSSPVTFLSCHQRGNVVIAGLADGTVELLSSSALDPLFALTPHLSCASYESDRVQAVKASDDPNVIVSVHVNLSVICITSAAGHMFCRALPDFVKFESDRNTSHFARLVKNPIQTVQQHAQTITDAASTLKIHIDETIGELNKKVEIRIFFIL